MYKCIHVLVHTIVYLTSRMILKPIQNYEHAHFTRKFKMIGMELFATDPEETCDLGMTALFHFSGKERNTSFIHT